MQLDGVFGDDQLVGNLLVGKTRTDKPENLAFAFGEALEYLCPLFLICAVTALGTAFVAGKIKSERVGAVDNLCAFDKVEASLVIGAVHEATERVVTVACVFSCGVAVDNLQIIRGVCVWRRQVLGGDGEPANGDELTVRAGIYLEGLGGP